jgi:hypothetical protein
MTYLRFLPAFLLFLSLFCRLPAAGAEPPALSVRPSAGTTATAVGAVYVFPAAHLLSDDRPLTHTFLLHNGAKKALTIARVAASCDCINAQFGKTSLLPVRIPSGAVLPVAVRLSPRRLSPGPFSRSVWLYWPGGPHEGLRLELRGLVRDDSGPAPAVSGGAVH